jgi:uncharacterized membrane protein
MITPRLNTDGYTGHILVEPNRPVSWPDNVRFIKLFALLSFIITSVAVSQGFFPVLPFSGIEVIFVAFCLYLVYTHYSTCQVIYFTADSVIIESGDRCAEKRVKYQRHWSKFHVDNKGSYTIPSLSICSKGKKTEIGHFLSYDDKMILIELVKTVTLKFQKKKF